MITSNLESYKEKESWKDHEITKKRDLDKIAHTNMKTDQKYIT